ncbi:MAG: helix-turn-helix domain-containing protein [Acutalibacteraceae bacterium]|jgi:AraC-like DNA-binding protein
MPTLCQHENPSMLFAYSRHEAAPQSWFTLHVHGHLELLYFVSGDAMFQIESSNYSMTPHTLMIARPMEAHKMNMLSDAVYERFVLNVDPQLIREFDPTGRLLRPFYNRPLGQGNAFSADEFGPLKPMDLFLAMCRPGLTAEQRRVDILTYLFPLLGQLAEVFDARQEHAAPPVDKQSYRVVEYVNRHLFDELSLESLSDEFFISPSQLSRMFKQATGSSVWNYILRKRLVAARRQLQSGQSAAFVCSTCGFRDYSSFYRAYKKEFGCSPGQDLSRRSSR